MARTFRDLDIYNRAYKAALAIHMISLDLPKTEQYALADQMRRCSRSICANIAEGFSKHHASTQEFKRFLSMAIGSANEMQVWCDFAKDLGYLGADKHATYNQEYKELASMMYSLSGNWKTA